MSNITPFDSDNKEKNRISDFRVEGKHARISQEKVADLTKVHQSTVSRWVCTNSDITDSNLDTHYFWGYELKNFVVYLALDAKRIKDEVRNHNIKLLSDASDMGFQNLIDKMAGIVPEPEPNTSNMLTVDHFNILMATMQKMQENMDSTKWKLTQEETEKERYKGLLYGLYPAKELFEKVEPSFRKFDRLEDLLEKLSKSIRKQGFSNCVPISELTKNYKLTTGEKINVSRMTGDWLQLNSTNPEIQELNKFIGRKKLYPLYVQPLVDIAVNVELSKRK